MFFFQKKVDDGLYLYQAQGWEKVDLKFQRRIFSQVFWKFESRYRVLGHLGQRTNPFYDHRYKPTVFIVD